ncbi:MAG: 16S rRNA (guanine(527)-N(7))-methyltransferase RsmG [Clostridia bacterium]|nr:16S rRNA (guanine(527)-N(7))-methyltransferase RsmG [Clostridia bacterium]
MSIITDIMTFHGASESVACQFDTYYKMLIEWNEKINLTAITEEREAALKHFVDCISAFSCDKISDGASVIDVGTGAGFPGLPLKIYNPTLKVTLMDSLNKRINFLNEVIAELGLSEVTTIHSRAEELGKNKAHREKYDVCVSRAVANLATLSELCLPFVKVGGYFVSMKGPKAEEELKAAAKAIELCGGKVEKVHSYAIDGTDYDHNLVVIKKVSPTPPRFPRNAPKPAKEPLI